MLRISGLKKEKKANHYFYTKNNKVLVAFEKVLKYLFVLFCTYEVNLIVSFSEHIRNSEKLNLAIVVAVLGSSQLQEMTEPSKKCCTLEKWSKVNQN